MRDLLAKYGKIAPLRADEEAEIRDLAMAKRHFGAGTNLVIGELDEPDQLFIVEKGRLFASVDLPGGERAITRLYFPGDIVGTANIPFERATHTVTISTAADLYIFPRSRLVQAFHSMPRLAAIFYTFAAMENAILNDRLVSVGRTRGIARLAALLMEICARQNLLHTPPERDFSLGLTQAQIADAIGLTEVQVSRLFRELMAMGLIVRHGRNVEIIDKPRLIEIGQFVDRYDDLDLEWFSEGG